MSQIALSHLQIRTPKDDETSIEAATQIFASLLSSNTTLLNRLFNKPNHFAFEIYLINQTIYFYVATPKSAETLMSSLISSSYPQSAIQATTDPLDIIVKAPEIATGEVVLSNSFYYPIKTYQDFSEIDPIAALIGFLSKQDPAVKMGIQILVSPASFPWQSKALASTKKQVLDPKTGTYVEKSTDVSQSLVVKKASFHGGQTAIRLICSTPGKELPALAFLQSLAGTYGVFAQGEGNQFGFKRVKNTKKMIEKMKVREMGTFENRHHILNAQELASLWHPAGKLLVGIKNLNWGKTLAGEAPGNIPVAENMTDEEKKETNFFAKTEYKNRDTIFGVKTPDRRKHIYIIGKTGAGKSTLIANMAIDDIRKDRGVGIIDPHGDLCETVLDYIPKRRLNDVVYLEPFDTERPFSLNVLEIKNAQHRDLIASGIVAIFSKLYAESWGPRLEYILRNTIITLLELPQATLLDALNILSNKNFREKAIQQIQDPVMKDFWNKEFNQMSDRLRTDAVSPIQNKVGQFVSSKMIRNIIGQYKSTVDLEEIMNEGKILLLNLSQGKLGEDNAALLGAMIITQIQLSAMNRAYIKEEDRRDFFLYVDEFQNFATSSFIKILSEARKYRLALTLTNQYIEQLDEDIMKAIFGNVGTLSSFVVGARDAEHLTKEFQGIYTEGDLVGLGKHEIVMKLSIDNMTSAPFPAKTLPLPALKNDNRDKIIRLSKERYGRKV